MLLILKSCSCNLEVHVLMMTWHYTCLLWALKILQGSRSFCSAQLILKTPFYLQNVQSSPCTGQGTQGHTRGAPSTALLVNAKILGLSLSLVTRVTKGLRPWFWGRCSNKRGRQLWCVTFVDVLGTTSVIVGSCRVARGSMVVVMMVKRSGPALMKQALHVVQKTDFGQLQIRYCWFL